MSGLRYTPLVASLPASVPFVGPETQERARGKSFSARIGANESVFGPSPRAVAAIRAEAAEIWRYGDPENHELRQALAAFHGIDPENIVIGEGIDGLLGYLARLLVGEGTPVVTSLGAYPTFNFHVTGYGARLCAAPYRDDAEDPEALLELARRENAPLIYLANPDNPMGSWHDATVIQHLIDSIPEGSLLCLDEAYVEFAPEGTAPPIDPSNPSVIRFRTFSKAYGMAGARIGYGIAEQNLVRSFDKVRNHFGVNRLVSRPISSQRFRAPQIRQCKAQVRRHSQLCQAAATPQWRICGAPDGQGEKRPGARRAGAGLACAHSSAPNTADGRLSPC